MADTAAAKTDADALQVVPPEVEFQGPFDCETKSNHTLTNTSAQRLCVKVKVFDALLVTSRPTCVFLAANEQINLAFKHGKFDYTPEEAASYSNRKVALYHTVAPEDASEPAQFAKEVPAGDWKILKIQVNYTNNKQI